mgnify:CR=1 FL=1
MARKTRAHRLSETYRSVLHAQRMARTPFTATAGNTQMPTRTVWDCGTPRFCRSPTSSVVRPDVDRPAKCLRSPRHAAQRGRCRARCTSPRSEHDRARSCWTSTATSIQTVALRGFDRDLRSWRTTAVRARSGWISPGDASSPSTPDRNGRIDDRSELFGAATPARASRSSPAYDLQPRRRGRARRMRGFGTCASGRTRQRCKPLRRQWAEAQ